MLAAALARGRSVPMIALGLILVASSMDLFPLAKARDEKLRSCRNRQCRDSIARIARPDGGTAILPDGILTVSLCLLYALTPTMMLMKIVHEGLSATIGVRLIGIRYLSAGRRECGQHF